MSNEIPHILNSIIIIKQIFIKHFTQNEVQRALERHKNKIPKSNNSKNIKGNITVNKENTF